MRWGVYLSFFNCCFEENDGAWQFSRQKVWQSHFYFLLLPPTSASRPTRLDNWAESVWLRICHYLWKSVYHALFLATWNLENVKQCHTAVPLKSADFNGTSVKKYILPLLSIAMMMTMASCSSSDDEVAENNNTDVKLVPMTFTATQETNVGTRAALDGDNKVNWQADDECWVQTRTLLELEN